MKISNAHGKCKGRVGLEQHAIHELHGRVRGVLDGRAATRSCDLLVDSGHTSYM